MRGELDFRASFKEHLALLQGLSEDVLEEIGASLRLTEGAEVLFAELKRLGYKTAILSGGFTYFAKQLQAKLGIDTVFANELQIVDGKVTGVAMSRSSTPSARPTCCASWRPRSTTASGADHRRGRWCQRPADARPGRPRCGFRAKPLVKQSAKQAISTLGLDGILYLLGFRDRDGQE